MDNSDFEMRESIHMHSGFTRCGLPKQLIDP